MNISTIEYVNKDAYNFKIKKTIYYYDDKIINLTIKLGKDYDDDDDCMNISYKYINGNVISANIPHLLYEPECALKKTLEKGLDIEIMIKTCLEYAYKNNPTISKFEFDDMSHIDCIDEINQLLKPPRKQIKPLNLAFLYIAYHSMTWYENKFNAQMKDPTKYKKYRESLFFLIDEKSKVEYSTFLSICSITDTNMQLYLKNKYINAKTYRDFFNNIPKKERCDILYNWLNNFMTHYIGNTFSTNNWIIDMQNINKRQIGGVNNKNKCLPKNYYIFNYKKIHILFI